MPLAIRSEGGMAKPVIICDHCGKEIDEAKQGNYQWDVAQVDKPQGGQVYFTHKACCRAFEALTPGRWSWTELDCLPVFLANNLKVNWKEAREKAAVLASIE